MYFVLLVCVATIFFVIADNVVLQTPFVQVRVDASTGCISSISADFEGESIFTTNILVAPLCLEVDQKLLATKFSTSHKYSNKVHHFVEDKSHMEISFQAEVLDATSAEVLIAYSGRIQVNPAFRSVTLNFNGETKSSFTATNIGYSFYLNSSSLYGLFDSGVVQMKDLFHGCMSGQNRLQRFYSLGEGSAVDILINESSMSTTSSPTIILVSSQTAAYHSALQYSIFGTYPNTADGLYTAWHETCWQDAIPTTVPIGYTWNVQFTVIPNEYNFPALSLNDIQATKDNLPFSYLAPYLTGIYASPVGCLQSYYTKQKGIISPTISHPKVSYAPDSNFFDPDNFIALSAMLYAGDEYLTSQVKDVLERTGNTMCGLGNDVDSFYCNDWRVHNSTMMTTKTKKKKANTRDGQLMHHFINLHPTYTSIAGSEQLGPNIFWTMMVIRYVAITQDFTWANKMLPFIQLSTQFLLSFLDETKQMIQAPGPLWIDVFVRENFTSDSNAMFIPYLTSVADFYDYVGLPTQEGDHLRAQVKRTMMAINDNLLAESGDHYITQLNPDGTFRDMIDYDSNLMAVAFGIANLTLADAILKRVDNGEYTHIRATWPSEVIYTGSLEDCYSGSGNSYDVCGDATVTMARIGWVDALARKRMNDITMVKDILLQPIINDLNKNTWLYERYDENGNPAHNVYYFEYPSFVTMVLREVVYGICISPLQVEIQPLSNESYHFHIGNINVDYSIDKVTLSLPGKPEEAKEKIVMIYHLSPSNLYLIQSSDKADNNKEKLVMSDTQGVLQFRFKFYDGLLLTATLVKSK